MVDSGDGEEDSVVVSLNVDSVVDEDVTVGAGRAFCCQTAEMFLLIR